MGGIGIGALGLLTHVPNLEGKYRQAVDGPCWTLGVDGGIGLDGHTSIQFPEVVIYLFHQIGTILVAAVDAAFQG